jgi:hypothetical protein
VKKEGWIIQKADESISEALSGHNGPYKSKTSAEKDAKKEAEGQYRVLKITVEGPDEFTGEDIEENW